MSHHFTSRKKMKKLLKLAEDHCAGSPMLPCKYLYRNQSREYFDDIFNNNEGIMVKRLKQKGRDPKSPINGNLSGLFFTANVKRESNTGKPLPTSPYGPSRFLVTMDYLIDTNYYNIYFADFYCIGTKCHYLILVIAEHESEADTFCKLHLPCLDWDENVFLRCNEYDNFEVTSKDHCIIEVMYTGNIDVNYVIANGGYITHNTPLNKSGTNLRKNLSCPTCNINPISTKKTKKKRSKSRSSKFGDHSSTVSIGGLDICQDLPVFDDSPYESDHDYN